MVVSNSKSEKDSILIHHGIRGQRWGVRRYQNEDGSLTSVGKKRYSISDKDLGKTKSIAESASKITGEAGKINRSISDMRRDSKKFEDLSKISDQQLKERVTRLNLERQYSDLTSSKIGKGQNYVGNILDIAGSTLAITGSALAIALSIRQLKGK